MAWFMELGWVVHSEVAGLRVLDKGGVARWRYSRQGGFEVAWRSDGDGGYRGNGKRVKWFVERRFMDGKRRS